MDSTPALDLSNLSYRDYVDQPSQPIPTNQELLMLQQELQQLSEKANLRFERYSSELSKLEGVSGLSKDFSASSSSTPSTSTSAATFGSVPHGISHNHSGSTGTIVSSSVPRSSASPVISSTMARTSTSPATSSPSSFGSARAGSMATLPGNAASSNPSLTKLGVVTLKLKRSDAPESAKTDDEQSSSSIPNTIKIRTVTPLMQDGISKKKKKSHIDDDSEYSEDDQLPPKSKRSDDHIISKVRSMSPQPVKLHTNRVNTPKASQHRTGDKAHSGSQQKKKKHSEHHTEKSQKPIPKAQEVQEDFSKVKVANQVPIQTFWTSMDPYFRPFTESDRTVLEEEGDQVTPLMIPPLGKHYLEVWADEEKSLIPFEGYDSRRNSVDSTKEPAFSRNTVHSTPFELTDENIEQDEVSCGPLTERILSSLISEDLVDPTELKQEDDQRSSSPVVQSSNPRNYAELEERIKRELRYIGLLGNEEINWDAREDDEVSITLRSLQKELRDVMKVNKSRKQKLLSLVNSHLAYQEYNTILDDLDKQVEQGYLKRFRMTKSKKKKTSTPKSLSENALSAMDRRRRFVQGVGPIFPAENFTIPQKSIYQDELQPKPTSATPQTYRQLNGLP